MIFNPVGLADLIVIASLLAPTLAENYSFLRVIRALRLLRSYHMIRPCAGNPGLCACMKT